ncbi:MAG: polysaccharide deacetylase family protein [Rhodopirellula sp.]|nr:polysaccharide deacetylase family protein [Rhodopirellula sp.]
MLSRGRRLRSNSGADRPASCAISLTFDDGPHPEFTPQLLDNLATVDIKGTFFIVGEKAQQHPDILKRIAAEGHEIGNHTWTHSEPRKTSTGQFHDEVTRTNDLIFNLTGTPCRLTRPPKGELSPGKILALLKLRQTIVLWNCDTKDYLMKSWVDMETWCLDFTPTHGDIVLMHDNHSFAATTAALAGTLPNMSGVRFCRVSEWLRDSRHSSTNTLSACGGRS